MKWSEKDRFQLSLSFLVGISSGIISAIFVSSIYEWIRYPSLTNLVIYIINWLIAGLIVIFFLLKIKKYEKLISK